MSKFVLDVIKKWQLVLYISLMLSAVTFFVSTAIAPKYRSDITVLITQKDADVLTASQNAEYLSDVFEKVLYTESFMRGVLKSDAEIKREFSGDAKKRIKEWAAEIQTEKVGSSGILKIVVFDPRSEDSYKIATGIVNNFKENRTEYFGEKDEVEIKILDGPISSSKVAYPDIKLNTALGFFVGVIGSLMIILFFEDFDLRLVRKSKRGIAFSIKSAEKAIEQKIGDQLVRQLEKRKDNVALEYLEKQFERGDDFATSENPSFIDTSIDTLNTLKQDVDSSKEIAKQKNSIISEELEYIDIPEEDDFDKEDEKFFYSAHSQESEVGESINKSEIVLKGSFSNRGAIKDLENTKEKEVEIVDTKKSSEDFWENMHSIDGVEDDLKDDHKDNPLLADSMVDIDRYHEIIQAGETFKGFKRLREQYQSKDSSETDIENKKIALKEDSEKKVDFDGENDAIKQGRGEVVELEKELDLPELKRGEEEKESDAKREIVAKKDDKETQKELGLTKKTKEQVKEEALELTAVGLKKILATQNVAQQEDESDVVVKAKEDEEQNIFKEKDVDEEILQVESMSPIGDIDEIEEIGEIVEEKESLEPSTEKEEIEDEEDFEEIVEKKKKKEKEEIERLLEEEIKKNVQIEQELVSNKIKKKEEDIINQTNEPEEIESIDYIGSADANEDDELELNTKEIQRSTQEGSEHGNAFARLYEKSLFNDDKYKEQQAKRVTHHMEMDPEELEMMRKMLEAEGKSEEEFVLENGLVEIDEESAESLKKENVKDVELNEKISIKKSTFEPVEESVRKIETTEELQMGDKKGAAPHGLAIFMEEEDEQDTFARNLLKEKVQNKGNEQLKGQAIDKIIDPNKEVSEEEIKDRLNRLLQGEL